MENKTYKAICQNFEGSIETFLVEAPYFKDAKEIVKEEHQNLRLLRLQLLDKDKETVLKEIRYSKKVLDDELVGDIERRLAKIKRLEGERKGYPTEYVNYEIYGMYISNEKDAILRMMSRLTKILGKDYYKAFKEAKDDFSKVVELFQSVKDL